MARPKKQTPDAKPTAPVGTNSTNGYPLGVEAPFYPGRAVLTLSKPQFDLAWAKLCAARVRPQGDRARKAAEMVMVQRMSYKRAAVALGEKAAYVRTAHVWVLDRLLPFVAEIGVDVATQYPPLVLDNVPPELHAGIRERVARMVAQYHATVAQPAGSPAEET